ncbi:hypothetical protein EDB86DRAFT_2832808 [Lactarius hatsudake]|nr:hypothetical protein EDB86DRAFT_2832808 [Lactarius hatsudake]
MASADRFSYNREEAQQKHLRVRAVVWIITGDWCLIVGERLDENGHMSGRKEEGLRNPFIANDGLEMMHFGQSICGCIVPCVVRITRTAETGEVLSLGDIIRSEPQVFRSPENRQSRPRRKEKQPSHQSPGKWRPQDGRDNPQVNRNWSAIEWECLDPSFAYDVEDRANGRSGDEVLVRQISSEEDKGDKARNFSAVTNRVAGNLVRRLGLASAPTKSLIGNGAREINQTANRIPPIRIGRASCKYPFRLRLSLLASMCPLASPPRRPDEPARQYVLHYLRKGIAEPLDKDHIKLRGIGDLSIFSEGVTYFSCKFHMFWKPVHVIGGLIGETQRLGE